MSSTNNRYGIQSTSNKIIQKLIQHNKPIPSTYKTQGWLINCDPKYGFTPLHMWVFYKPNTPIPSEISLLSNPSILTYSNTSAAMMFITRHSNVDAEVPTSL